jgi:hypothetical protein
MEDISYLKENSVADSMSFYIDSGTRDKNFWPTPSEYSITFEQPFRFVYGFDVLDGAIPTTQYNVDYANNNISMTMFSVPTGEQLSGAQPYIAEIVCSKDFVNLFENPTTTYALLIDESAVNTFSLATLSSTISADATIFYAFVRKDMTGVPIVPKRNQLPSDYYFFSYKNREYAIKVTGNTAAIDLIARGGFYLNYDPSGVSSTIIYYNMLNIDNITYNLLYNAGTFQMNIFNYRFNVNVGNFDIGTFRGMVNDTMNAFDITLETTTPVETKQGRYKFTSSTKIMIMNGRLSTLRDNIGFSQLPSDKMSDYYAIIEIGDNPYVYMSIYDDFNQVYKLEGPGLVNFFGERFVIMKIKEIEDHLLGSYSYMSFSPGIGLFKLASSFNDVTNLRFDYVSMVRKPFHPIGKVYRLTIRFETSMGQLYDFKGVDHQMLMVIKFLVPTPKVTFHKSLLNPNYDPNFVRYMANNQTVRNREDSDDEEDFDDEENRVTYTKQMRKYNYSSSGEDDDSEEDIEQLHRERRLLPI